VRRGAAWPLAERPSSCLAVQPAVSRADRWPHRRAPSWLPSARACRPQQHGSPSSRPSARRGGPDDRMPTVALVVLSTSACPASARPVSGVVGVQASALRCPVPGVQCPVSAHAGVHASAVQCRVRTSGVPRRCPRVPRRRPPCLHPRLPGVRRSADYHTVKKGPRSGVRCIRGRLDHLPEPSGLWSGVSGVASGAWIRSEAATTLRGHRGRSGLSRLVFGAF
jgi:hypothetical protein